MIIFNDKNIKEIKFDLAVANVDIKDLKGRFILTFNDVDYGFNATIRGGEIHVKIPPLKNVIKGLVNNSKLSCRLEIIADDTLLIPFEGECLVEMSVEVKTKIKSESKNVNIKFDEIDKIISEQRLKNLVNDMDRKLKAKIRKNNV